MARGAVSTMCCDAIKIIHRIPATSRIPDNFLPSMLQVTDLCVVGPISFLSAPSPALAGSGLVLARAGWPTQHFVVIVVTFLYLYKHITHHSAIILIVLLCVIISNDSSAVRLEKKGSVTLTRIVR